MNLIRVVLSVLPILVCSPALAETMKFEDAAAMLGASCAKDINESCRGVNLDSVRLKDCLARNEDTMSPQCKADYTRAFGAIQKRVAARAAVRKICVRDVVKVCGGAQKDEGDALKCILTATRGLSVACNKAIAEAGYR
ncbi:MAG TPA: hypothetical protein VJV58_01575 [Bradyrhizobium sp.]|uniref:hypothetical protein n=1 Tax=Bradyrhizobium sp. TaxID=376 RepID=UPI002B4A1772|nr:hypothetical protein [Bradyrhizobium sp.]HKO69599.1 hypothetical protein [Bradyrhizobium sp.]